MKSVKKSTIDIKKIIIKKKLIEFKIYNIYSIY